jgi:hypothetical protein
MEETLPSSWTEDGMSKRRLVLVIPKNKKRMFMVLQVQNISNKTVIIDRTHKTWGTIMEVKMAKCLIPFVR